MEMELSLLASWVSIVLFALSAVYVVYSTTRGRSLRKLPSPPGWWPVIGHLHLMTDMPHQALAELAKSMRAPLLHLQLGSIPVVVISKPDLARDALTTHDVALASRPQHLAGQVLAFGCSDVASSPEGPYHRMARGVVVSELLSPRRVAAFSGVRGKEVRRLLAFLAKKETTVDLSACLRNMSNDVFCLVAFGRRFPQSQGDKLNAVFAETQNLYGGFTVGDFFPELEPIASTLTGLRRRLNNCLVGLREICGEFFEEHTTGKHKRIPFPGGDRDEDFIDVLLRVQKSSSLDVPLTDDNLMSIVVVW
jgi:cytochrome P450